MPAQLDAAIHAIQVRYGTHALRRADALPAPTPWPVGIEAVERLSGIGGLPLGRLTILQGTGTSGKLSLALAMLARATHEFAHAVVIDSRLGFDPWSLLPLDPQLAALAVVRPPHDEAAGEAATALAKAGAGFLLATPLPETWLNTLEAAAARSGTVVVIVAEAVAPVLAHASSLTFALERARWIWERGQLIGITSRLRCVKNKVASPGLEAELETRYPLGTQVFFDSPVRTATPVSETEWLEQEEARSAAG